MTKFIMDPEVDKFLGKAKKWREEFEKLRMICLGCGLTEEFKWMHPCYTFQGKNIVLIHGFKKYCALLIFKGALLKDTKGYWYSRRRTCRPHARFGLPMPGK